MKENLRNLSCIRMLRVVLLVAVVLSNAYAQDATKLPVEPNHAEALSFVSSQKSITEMTAKMDYENVCELNRSTVSGISSTNVILFVGTVSSLVFSFIGIFPAFFIHTDDQEKVFSKWTSCTSQVFEIFHN